MAPSVTSKTDALTVNAYVGDAKTLLAWDLAPERATNLAGFTIECAPPGQSPYYLQNSLRFETPGDHAQDASEPANSSINAPLHKFRWLHVPGSVHQGLAPVYGTYSYVVTPRYFDGHGVLESLDPSLGVGVDVAVGPYARDGFALAFTRGYTQSQAFVDHFGPKAKIRPDGGELLFDTSLVAGSNARGEQFTYAQAYEWLGFTARSQVLAILDEVLGNADLRLDMFAYDLNEPDVLRRLLELAKQGRIRIVLDNASLHHSAKEQLPEDEFEQLFDAAAQAPAEMRRGHFSRYAHDKVLVVSGPGGPTKVLTGSTNFSVTGLYVNSNHVLVFEDAETTAKYAALFEEVWKDEVKRAPYLKSEFASGRFAPAGAMPARQITFAPHSPQVAAEILDGLVQRIGREAGGGSVLFAVMGLAGENPVYDALRQLHTDDSVFSFGVSDDPDGIALYQPGSKAGVLVTGKPVAVRLPPPFNQVPGVGAGHQIHHKFVVCGFTGDDPTVFCGSSNLALGGEQSNGDNLLEIHDAGVATAFAIEALALVDHFQFLDRSSTPKSKSQPPPASKQQAASSAGWFLSTSDAWAKPYFDAGDLHFVDRTLFA